jgi:LacI family transcriptional regulator
LRAKRSGAGRRPTLADVAREAGVSLATASRVLGGYGYASEENRRVVEAAAAKLDYSPNVVARSMRGGGTRSIGFVGADIANPFFASAMRGVGDVARGEGYETILTNSDEQLDLERSAVKVLLEKQIEGIVVAPASVVECDHLARAQEQGVPVVLLDRSVADLDADSVVIDNEAAARDAVAYLFEQGHRRVGLVASVHPEEHPDLVDVNGKGRVGVLGAARPSIDRIRGYVQALDEAGVAPLRQWIRYSPVADGDRAEADARELLSLSAARRPTAVFAADNAVTRALFTAARGLGLRIPDDVSILGFDDLEWTTLVDPPLSVVAQSPYEMGRMAAERLFARIKGDESARQQIVLPTRLALRSSIRARRRRT